MIYLKTIMDVYLVNFSSFTISQDGGALGSIRYITLSAVKCLIGSLIIELVICFIGLVHLFHPSLRSLLATNMYIKILYMSSCLTRIFAYWYRFMPNLERVMYSSHPYEEYINPSPLFLFFYYLNSWWSTTLINRTNSLGVL